MTKENMTVIDLFSGAGGLSLGFSNKGFCNIFSVDIEPDSCRTYRKNFPTHTLIQKDIATLEKEDILSLTEGKKVDVIVGGPPCQGFSMAGNVGRKFIDDPRNHLFKEFARVISILRPKIFLMENVARLYTHNNGKTKEEILKTFNSLGYHTECKVLNVADYGVPQIRSRVIFIGTCLKNNNIIFPSRKYEPNKYITIKEAIDDLPILKSGEASKVPNHIAMKHSAQMLKKMSFIKDGGTKSDIPIDLRPLKGDARKYIRYNSSKPSVCVTGDMRKIFHYSQNRALTVRELARIQTYPDDFIFEGSSISQQQQVGNSVPPLFAEALAESVEEMLKNA